MENMVLLEWNSKRLFVMCLAPQEVVQRAVTACQIPWAQAFLRRQASPELCLEELKKRGLLQVFRCLQIKDLGQATSLLRNMVRWAQTEGFFFSVLKHSIHINLRLPVAIFPGLIPSLLFDLRATV